MTTLPAGDRLLRSTANPAWLPLDSAAHVVAAAEHATAPDPTCLVRALVTHAGDVLAVPRADDRGFDLPTRRVDGARPGETLRSLVNDVVGAACDATLLGYVMNVVDRPSDDYPWPTPYAHFAVWHTETDDAAGARGVWLDAATARTHLRQRHWWPLHRLVESRQATALAPRAKNELLSDVLDTELVAVRVCDQPARSLTDSHHRSAGDEIAAELPARLTADTRWIGRADFGEARLQ